MGLCDCTFYTGMATIFMSMGWALNLTAIWLCDLVSTGEGNIESIGRVYNGFGLYSFHTPADTCYLIQGGTNLPFWTDRYMNAARVCAGVAAFLALFEMVFMWFALCCGCLMNSFITKMYAFGALINTILVGLTFLIFQSGVCERNNCSFARGSGVVIGAMFAYFCCAVLCCITPKKKDSNEEGDNSQGRKADEEAPQNEDGDGLVQATPE